MKHHDPNAAVPEKSHAAPVSVDAMREGQPAQKLPKPPKPRKVEKRRRGRKG